VANGGDPTPKAAVEKLFEPFFRGDVRASNCHCLADREARDGVLSVNSTVEKTGFTFLCHCDSWV
jgi:sigma-B regulation protein RsbU (phosphoserine phosphatase)